MEFTQGAPFDNFGLSGPPYAIRNKGYEINTPFGPGASPMLAGRT